MDENEMSMGHTLKNNTDSQNKKYNHEQKCGECSVLRLINFLLVEVISLQGFPERKLTSALTSLGVNALNNTEMKENSVNDRSSTGCKESCVEIQYVSSEAIKENGYIFINGILRHKKY
ncbi:unnamed protein product [Owenia fusiformis]|uniref:Uncharacterized protein n=1 Tax=Owenia fusiformis TaxID=6347 RepID=A0A8J1U0I3_OWEFU|nr:unnamed protein product [Owenia fusiformis]